MLDTQLALAHIDRMNLERNELSERMSKLHAFINGSDFDQISAIDQDLLLAQRDAMKTYSTILTVRVRRAEESAEAATRKARRNG
jgi:hypothetical protein